MCRAVCGPGVRQPPSSPSVGQSSCFLLRGAYLDQSSSLHAADWHSAGRRGAVVVYRRAACGRGLCHFTSAVHFARIARNAHVRASSRATRTPAILTIFSAFGVIDILYSTCSISHSVRRMAPRRATNDTDPACMQSMHASDPHGANRRAPALKRPNSPTLPVSRVFGPPGLAPGRLAPNVSLPPPLLPILHT